ncbi:hypothetical protein IFM89_008778 [Coptis chinensis]|uniref:eRF1/Pelota-like N-terminal domain-containing protein n=1 Tax=Coptis chinensis TaxID=261450 RepID=A0A835GYN9_9MAGN|nr:hypothetical protein IFM89_008778 [Coptis chinensis]
MHLPHQGFLLKPVSLNFVLDLRLTMSGRRETDKNIEIWKMKKLINSLEAARGKDTSMISLIVPPRDQIARVTKMLGDEFATASNMKSKVDRQSVLDAITSAQQRLELYSKVPPNEALNELLEYDDKFGFIVMDGNGALSGMLSANTCEVLHRFTVDLPNNVTPNSLRFARLRMESCHNYVRKTAELATQFLVNVYTSQPNVSGLILAGSGDFKTQLIQSDMLHPRLQAKILNVVDVSYGGEDGFNQAIDLSAEICPI